MKCKNCGSPEHLDCFSGRVISWQQKAEELEQELKTLKETDDDLITKLESAAHTQGEELLTLTIFLGTLKERFEILGSWSNTILSTSLCNECITDVDRYLKLHKEKI